MASGIEVQSPTFRYSGKFYSLTLRLTDLDTISEDGKSSYSYPLQMTGIQMLEFSAGFNDLFLEATLDYIDTTGQVLTFVGRQNVVCLVGFNEIVQEFDESFSSEKIPPEKSFDHNFLVTSLEIVKRSGSSIQYKIHLVGIEWLKLAANVVFSNYGSSKLDIFQILKICLAQNGLEVNEDSFSKVKSKVQIQYATSGSENVMTVFNYLMSRLYYYADNYEEAMKFLWIDHISGKYNIFDFRAPASSSNPKNLVITTNSSNLEKDAQEDVNQLGSMSSFPTIDFYQSLFQKQIIQFSYDSNSFDTSKMFTDDQILQYSNNSLMMQAPKTQQFSKIPVEEAVAGKNLSRFSEWQNPTNIYSDQAKALLVGKSIIINTVGNIAWKPTQVVNLEFQKDTRQIQSEQPKEKEVFDASYSGLNGTWIITKVRHIIQPNGSKKYRQNLILARNFKMPEESTSEK